MFWQFSMIERIGRYFLFEEKHNENKLSENRHGRCGKIMEDASKRFPGIIR